MSCADLNTEERYIPVGSYKGRLAYTLLNNKELLEQGVSVLRRFDSLPNVVQIQGYNRYFSGQLIESSDSLKALVRQYSKSKDFLDKKNLALPRAFSARAQPLELTAQPGHLDPFKDGGFGNPKEIFEKKPDSQDAMQNLTDDKSALEVVLPVKVAIIDSGLVASTSPLKSSLVQSINLTNGFNVGLWRDHATAIGSLFSGTEQNGLAENSYAPNSRLLSIKIAFSGDESSDRPLVDSMLQLAVALDEAIASGTKVVNMSFSYTGTVPSEIQFLERALIAKGAERGVVFVAAAGNESTLLDLIPSYPARYDMQNLVVVGNHGPDHRRSPYSNYGNSVDLTAYGESVPLNTVQASLKLFSGTSFSAPMVAAALAYSMGLCPELDWHTRLGLLRQTALPPVDNSSRFGRLQAQRFWEVSECKSEHFRGRSNKLPQLTKPQSDPSR